VRQVIKALKDKEILRKEKSWVRGSRGVQTRSLLHERCFWSAAIIVDDRQKWTPRHIGVCQSL